MKIAHITTVHTVYDTRILYKECATLAASGFDVVLIGGHENNETINGVKIRAIPSFTGRIKRMVFGGWAAYKAAIEEGAQICHLHDPELLPFGQLLRLGGRTVIFDMHENVPASICDKEWIPKRLRWFVKAMYLIFERTLLHKLHIVFAELSYTKYYPYIQSSQVILNYPFSTLINMPRNVTGEEFTIGYMGGISLNRGMDVIMKALKILDSRGLTITWHCIGRIPDNCRSVLDAKINELTYVTVKLHGRLKPDDGWKILSGCCAGLAILKPIGNYRESYPTKMFEYMALGVPVITSNFDLYKKVVETHKCGLCVDPESIDEIATAIQWYFENRGRVAIDGNNGKQAIAGIYNWESEGRKLIKYYLSLGIMQTG